jgi:integrase
MLLEIFGPARAVATLTHRDAARFVAELQRRGDQRPGRAYGRPRRSRMLDYDVKFLQTVLNCAVNAGWLDRNSLKGFRVHREETPQRPILTAPQYESLLRAADQVSLQFRFALVVAHETGDRIGAVRLLKWSDINFEQGTARWRGDNDKRRYDHTTPLTSVALDALQEARKAQATIGDTWVFPAPGDPFRPVSRHLLRDWWQRVEMAAGLAAEPRRGWHSLRRKFATEMKQTPLKDLARWVGGRITRPYSPATSGPMP